MLPLPHSSIYRLALRSRASEIGLSRSLSSAAGHEYLHCRRGIGGFALRSDRDEIRRRMQNGSDNVGRLCRLPVELSHAHALQLARQIKESIVRQQAPQTEAPDTDDSVDYAIPVLTGAPSAPVKEVSAEGNKAASDIVAAPGSVRSGAPRLPAPSGTTAAAALLRDALAQGPWRSKRQTSAAN
jgi:hypothetical protein